jgi:hypothetical protein
MYQTLRGPLRAPEAWTLGGTGGQRHVGQDGMVCQTERSGPVVRTPIPRHHALDITRQGPCCQGEDVASLSAPCRYLAPLTRRQRFTHGPQGMRPANCIQPPPGVVVSGGCEPVPERQRVARPAIISTGTRPAGRA